MVENNSQDPQTDGGIAGGAAAREEQVDYLQTEINLLSPSTPYMREHLRIVWTGFIAWCVITFAPITATVLAPEAMSSSMPVLAFPWHYFLVAIGGPTGSLVLAAWYARKRDQLDEKYGVSPAQTETEPDTDAVATDGGVKR